MPISSQRAKVTTSEPIAVTTKPRDIPGNRAKKSKESSDCSAFNRALLHNDISLQNETETFGDNQGSAGRKKTERGNGGPDINGKRGMPAFDETLERLFGPHAKHKSIPRRRWELDSHTALFGPDGQMSTSDDRRHYDIFEVHRDMMTRRQRQRVDDTQNELFGHMGDNIELTHPWSPSSPGTYDAYQQRIRKEYDRVFCQDLESSDGELPTVVVFIFTSFLNFLPRDAI